MVEEVVFSRQPITRTDMRLLEEGNDLNDALLDFFMKLGQALLPPAVEKKNSDRDDSRSGRKKRKDRSRSGSRSRARRGNKRGRSDSRSRSRSLSRRRGDGRSKGEKSKNEGDQNTESNTSVTRATVADAASIEPPNLHPLSSLFYRKLTGQGAPPDEAWEAVKRWTLKIPGGIFKPDIIAIAINEEFKDEKDRNCGYHWWLALLVGAKNAGGVADHSGDKKKKKKDKKHRSADDDDEVKAPVGRSFLLCIDSMKRRTRLFGDDANQLKNRVTGTKAAPSTNVERERKLVYKRDSLTKYSLEITKIEQAGFRIWVDFDCKGDGSLGLLQDPSKFARLLMPVPNCPPDQVVLEENGRKYKGIPANDIGLHINNNMKGQGVLRYKGSMEFLMDSRDNPEVFVFDYGPDWNNIELKFDAYNLSKYQKDVARYVQGMMRKEWEREKAGDKKAIKAFDKTAIQAVAVDAPQQENLNDCGMFVLENCMRLLTLGKKYPHKILKDPTDAKLHWVGQVEVKHRRKRLLECLQHLFTLKGKLGVGDVDAMMQKEPALRQELFTFLTDDAPEES
mmetsp:Transcript_24512/g.61682  ORF Transcript_24512/g.61682 Transcript_24512/m.61682 type:complete len:564 (+) Transcript_24512:122-1813(+)